jgi:hypothetical protein
LSDRRIVKVKPSPETYGKYENTDHRMALLKGEIKL